MPSLRAPGILWVEDSEADRYLIRECLGSMAGDIHLRFVESAREAISYLRGLSSHELPKLVVLDVHLPGPTGLHLLSTLRREPALCRLKAAFFTSCQQPEEMEKARALGAAGYFLKSAELESIAEAVTRIARLAVD